MCWTSSCKKSQIPHVVKRSIKAFKFVVLEDDTLKSYHYSSNLTYKLGEEYNTELLIEKNEFGIVISSGFHSYGTVYLDARIGIFMDIEDPDNKKNTRLMECIIPKGATYYLNNVGHYVSNSIIPVKLVNVVSHTIE